METFTPWESLAGGILIGLSASILLLVNGRIAGISGMLAGALNPARRDALWRVTFLVGLVVGGVAIDAAWPEAIAVTLGRSIPAFAIAGFFVGVGTRLGNGCTSGHGVCGISRGSVRSIVATLVFVTAGMATVYVLHHVVEGGV